MKRSGIAVALAALVMGPVSAGAAPFAWIAHEFDGTVSRMDLATHETVTIPVGARPINTAASPDGLRAYASNQLGDSVSVIDALAGTVIATVPVSPAPRGIGVRADSQRVYVANSNSEVAVIDPDTNTVVKTIFVGGSLETLVTNSAGTRAYVTKTFDGVRSIAVLDTVTDTFTADVFVAMDFGLGYALAVSRDDTRVYTASLDGVDVEVIDATTNLLVDTIPLSLDLGSPLPAAIAVSADGTRLYVAENSTNRLAILDAVGMTEVTTLEVGNGPRGVDLTPDGSRAYVINSGNARLSILNTASETIVGTVLTVEQYPSGFGRFIAPGPTTTSTTTTTTATSTTATTTTVTSSTTTTTLLPSPPVLTPIARVCQEAIAGSWKKYAAKAHGYFVKCLTKLGRDLGNGAGSGSAAVACVEALDPGDPGSSLARARIAARARALGRCAGVTATDLAQPCSPTATTAAEVIDCVLDRQLTDVVRSVGAEYGMPCSLATAVGLDGFFPGLCTGG